MESPVWLITGCSVGFGREIATVTLERGCRVVVTARNPASIEDFRERWPETALATALDVTDRESIRKTVERATATFGRIDVLVNNAGRGYLSAVEEGEEEEIRGIFELNVFGLIWMTQAVLPIMRAQRSGTVVNLSSIGGLRGNPGHGYYASTKFAIEGLSDALSRELEPLGIKVLVVEPGGFRTDFFERNRIKMSSTVIPDYAETAGAWKNHMLSLSGKQQGNARLGAELIVKAVESKAPPLRLAMGSSGMAVARAKLQAIAADIDYWEEESRKTDYPEGS